MSEDSAVLSKSWGATMTSPFYQYGLELVGGTVPNLLIGLLESVPRRLHGDPLATNRWSDLAITFDGVHVQFYVDGALVKDVLFQTAITARGTSLHGGADVTPGQFFKGLVRRCTDLPPCTDNG